MSATRKTTHAVLHGLQQQFLARLQGGTDTGIEARVDRGRVSRQVGLRIYAHAYKARLREALASDHPALATYLGDALWDALCHGYVAAHPSRHASLRDFGNRLPEYLETADPFATHAEIAEIARFERGLLDSFDAADAPRADWAALLAMAHASWPALTIHFHPSARLHRVAHNSVEIWRAIGKNEAPPVAAAGDANAWLLWRDVEDVGRYRSLDAAETAALAHCMGGGDFAGLCSALGIFHAADAVPAQALAYLGAWTADGCISRWQDASIA